MSDSVMPFMEDGAGRIRAFVDRSMEPWVCFEDARRLLGIPEWRCQFSELASDMKRIRVISGEKVVFIRETALNFIFLMSDKPAAKSFCMAHPDKVLSSFFGMDDADPELKRRLNTPELVITVLEFFLDRGGCPLRFRLIDDRRVSAIERRKTKGGGLKRGKMSRYTIEKACSLMNCFIDSESVFLKWLRSN
jgi:hypothetical protein